jgi:hypothetical protein
MVAMAMFVLFGLSLAYVIYKLIRQVIGLFNTFNRRINKMARSAEVAVEAFRYSHEDPDKV